MVVLVGAVCLFVGIWGGRLWGRSQVARLVWSLLEDNSSRSMVGAMLLYAAKDTPLLRLRRGWYKMDDVYHYLKRWEGE